MRPALLLTMASLLVMQCGAAPDQADHQSEWRSVLEHKKAALAPEAAPHDRQAYADALAAFVRKHPRHSRAREVFERIQLEFARDLASLGRYQDSIRFYRAVLHGDPANAQARKGLGEALDRLAVSHENLLAVEMGMSKKEVTRILGKPVPGWTVKAPRRAATIEAWYYRTTDGGVAAIYFRDGAVFAAEKKSQARVAL